MKTIVVSYSHSGNNAWLARQLQDWLNCDVEEIVEPGKRTAMTILLDIIFKRQPKINPSKAFLDTYDMVIFAGPVWNGRIAAPMASFIQREKYNIRNYAFITLCGGQQGQKEKLREELILLAQQEPLAVCELEVNDLVRNDQRGKIRYTTSYRVKKTDFTILQPGMREFVDTIIDFEDTYAAPPLRKNAI
jgi:flavodoxin